MKEFITLPIDKIVEYKFNNKDHPVNQIQTLKKSITEFGQVAPIEVDENYILLAGHGRLIAMRELGFKEVSALVVSGLTEKQKKAYRIASNKTADLGVYNLDNLSYEFSELDDIDLEVTGFSLAEIERLKIDDTEEDNAPITIKPKSKSIKINITAPESIGEDLLNDITKLVANNGYKGVEVKNFIS